MYLQNQINDENHKIIKTTKRNLIRQASKIQDPCGLISLYTICPKILLQDVWREQLEWDDVLPPEIEEKWNDWICEMDELRIIELPRYYFEDSKEPILDI